MAGYHAEKSGHSSFSQSTEQLKPLTEEEKAERLKELKAKMDEKRKVQAEASKEDDKRNEIIRQQRGKAGTLAVTCVILMSHRRSKQSGRT